MFSRFFCCCCHFSDLIPLDGSSHRLLSLENGNACVVRFFSSLVALSLKKNGGRETHIQKKIKAQLLDAKAKSSAKDKRGALFALKRKKMYEGEVNKLNGARMTLESQVGESLGL